MVARDTIPPRHIEPDAIIEAILELRLDAPTVLPEVLFGRLAEHSAWTSFQQRRLPAYEVPSPLREADPTLRFAPIFELADTEAKQAIRIGPHVFAYHHFVPYPSWPDFRVKLFLAVDELFSKAPGLTVRRLGLRYLNALRQDKHGISSARDLDINVTVSQEPQQERININYLVTPFDGSQCMVRIATRDFVAGPAPPEATVFVDVDVFTKDEFQTTKIDEVKTWVDLAHDHLKREFFHVLKPETIAQLKRD